MEDDIKYNSDYHSLELEKALQSIPSDYEMIYLGYCWDKCHKLKSINKYVSIPNIPRCRHAYVLSRKGAIKLLHHLKPLTNLPGDEEIAKIIKKKLLITYNLTIPLFNQNRKQFGSNLGNNDSLKLCK